MKYGLWLRNGVRGDVASAVERAVLAEATGWDGVFVSDSIWEGWSDPWVTLGAIASRTEQIALGTWVTPVPQQHPWRLAHSVAAVDNLSSGRVLLGTGYGVPAEYDIYGDHDPPAVRGRRYDEALDVMAALWSGETLDHDGEFFRLSGARLPVLPAQRPRVPVLPGGWWPNRAPFRRAARWDGVMPFWPALMGGQQGPAGQPPSDADPRDELRDLLAHYNSLTDDPGIVLVPWVRSLEGYEELCEELGVTWLLLTAVVDDEQVEAGPEGLPAVQRRP